MAYGSVVSRHGSARECLRNQDKMRRRKVDFQADECQGSSGCDRRAAVRPLRSLGWFILSSLAKLQGVVLAKRRDARGGAPKPSPTPARHATEVTVRRRPDGTWELQHPRCAIERDDDLHEVEAMIAAGEQEIAQDELRWLLEGCSDNMAAHALLGELAMQAEDWALARGHFGYAYQIGLKAIHRAGSPAPIPFEHPANQTLFSAGKGLVYCLLQLDKRDLAGDVVEFLVHCDPRDPLNLKGMWAAE